MKLNTENAKIILEKYLSQKEPKKYRHSLEVAKMSANLAKKWKVNVEDAVIAALLHDIGKSMSKQEMLGFCARNSISIYDFELWENPTALHGKISAILFKREFAGNNKKRIRAISHAIESHVAGRKNMKLLDKIIFIADNLQSKEGGLETFGRIMAERKKRPNYYIDVIIKGKLERAIEDERIPNPGLGAITSNSEQREVFLQTLEFLALPHPTTTQKTKPKPPADITR